MTPEQFRDEAAIKAMVELIKRSQHMPSIASIASTAWGIADQLTLHRQVTISKETRPVQTPTPDDICRSITDILSEGSEDIRPSDSP